MTIRVGILGCGKIARLHAGGYQAAADLAQVVVCCDEYNIALAQKMAAPFGAESTDNWRSVIERDDIDAISVCMPPYQHAEIVQTAAEAGKHILVEKPFGMDLLRSFHSHSNSG